MVGLGRVEGVATAGADAERADPFGVDPGPGGQEVDRAADVLDSGRGTLVKRGSPPRSRR